MRRAAARVLARDLAGRARGATYGPRRMRFLRATVPLVLCLALAALVLAVAGGGPPDARAQGEGTLRDRIESGKAREGRLSGQLARLSRLEAAMAKDVAVLQGRVNAVQTELEAAQQRARATAAALAEEQARVARLQRRLAEVRRKLSALLRQRYVNPEPDVVTVLVNARGFEDLLETVEYVRRVQTADTRLLDVVRAARADAKREEARLDELSDRRDAEAEAIERQRNALGGILSSLQARRAALAAARAARQAALTRTRAGRRKAQKALTRLEAERAARARATSFSTPTPVGPKPSGDWAIPAAIVQCESGGQNLTPNGAGASGYYQMLPATWAGLGGSTRHAYQASKAEQDRLAAKLWAGGAGARNWVCASLVGVI